MPLRRADHSFREVLPTVCLLHYAWSSAVISLYTHNRIHSRGSTYNIIITRVFFISTLNMVVVCFSETSVLYVMLYVTRPQHAPQLNVSLEQSIFYSNISNFKQAMRQWLAVSPVWNIIKSYSVLYHSYIPPSPPVLLTTKHRVGSVGRRT
jgi:hypothetical protein